jgi:recombination protein RecA
MPPRKAKEVESEPVNVNDQLEKDLSGLGLGNMVKLAEDFCDMDVTCIPTGFPQLDYILHSGLRGIPCGRDMEVYSRDPELGKTSIAVEFIKAFQRVGRKTLFDDVERTMTLQYLKDQRVQVDPQADPTRYAVRLMRHEKDVIPAEMWLDTIQKLSNVMDLIVVDSVAALEQKANLEKEASDNNIVGGLSKMLSEFYKKNVAKRATVIWVNQMRTKIGAYSPSGSTPLDTTGGKAIKFYASIRLELSFVDKIKETKDGDPVGMRVKAFTSKNKVAPQWRSCNLSYLFGYGFSPIWDYMELALKLGIIEKKGSWLSFASERLGQGMLNAHKLLAGNTDLYKQLQLMVDGEDAVVNANASQAEKPAESEE